MIYKRFIRAIISLVAIIMMMIGACGCMEQKKALNIDDCLNYMSEKYGEEFSYLEAGSYQSANTMTIFVESRSIPNSKIYVMSEKVDGGVSFQDDYIAVKYNQEKNDVFEKLCNSVYAECRIIDQFEEKTLLSESFSAKTTFEEFFSDDKSKISMVIIVPPNISDDVFKDKIDEVVKVLVSNGFAGTVNLYLSNNDDSYRRIEKNDIWDSRDWFTSNCQVKINTGGKVDPYLWR